jgi:hypothetical protein
VLYLKYSSYYGDCSTQQNIVVYKLIKQIYKDSTYYSNKNISQYYDSTLSSELANISFNPHPTDSVLAIKLSQAIADSLLHLSSTALSDNNVFMSNFMGLYLKANNVLSGGSILYFDLLSSKTKMTIYYHNSEDTLNFNFVVNSSCSRINLFNHPSYSNTNIHFGISNQDSVVYMQSMAGTKIQVCFPYLGDYIKKIGSIAINKAELIIKRSTNDGSYSSFAPPAQLLALMPSTSATSGYSFLPDYNISTTYFDGKINKDDGEPYYYRFNISLYLQKVISGTYSNSGIYLFSTDDRVSANRVVLTSGSSHNNPMKLKITYTKL